MKKHLLALFVLLLGVAPVLSSCSDDDDDTPTIVNNAKYGETNFALTKGLLVNWGEENDAHNFDITLMSPGVSYDANDDSFAGNGYTLYMEMFTSESELAAGTYTYNSEYDVPGTFTSLVLSDESNPAIFFYEGTIVVSKVGAIYTLVINGTSANNEELTVTYVGALQYFAGE